MIFIFKVVFVPQLSQICIHVSIHDFIRIVTIQGSDWTTNCLFRHLSPKQTIFDSFSIKSATKSALQTKAWLKNSKNETFMMWAPCMILSAGVTLKKERHPQMSWYSADGKAALETRLMCELKDGSLSSMTASFLKAALKAPLMPDQEFNSWIVNGWTVALGLFYDDSKHCR